MAHSGGQGLRKKSSRPPLGERRLRLAPRRAAKVGTWLLRGRRLRAPPPSAPPCLELLAGIRSPSLCISLPFPETSGIIADTARVVAEAKEARGLLGDVVLDIQSARDY